MSHVGTELQQRGRALYDVGATILYASRADPRFSYCLYVPPDIAEPGPAPELVVSAHGTGRNVADYRDWFAGFAHWNRCIVLAPLFPAGVRGDRDRDGYKYMQEGDIRYDTVLLDMVAEVEALYQLSFSRFALWGYSGGGHFVHRFLLLHPDRLWAASIGAPGSVTLLDQTRDWWVGTRDMAQRFGVAPNVEAMRQVAVHMVVGGADRETWEITHKPRASHWMEGANDAGATRPERLEALRRNYEAHGIDVAFELVPGVSHDGARIAPRAEAFFARTLRRQRERPADKASAAV